METICPWCKMPIRDGDTHGEPKGKPDGSLDVQCRVSVTCAMPNQLGVITAIRDPFEETAVK